MFTNADYLETNIKALHETNRITKMLIFYLFFRHRKFFRGLLFWLSFVSIQNVGNVTFTNSWPHCTDCCRQETVGCPLCKIMSILSVQRFKIKFLFLVFILLVRLLDVGRSFLIIKFDVG